MIVQAALAVPVLASAVLAAGGRWAPRPVVDALAALAVTATAVLLGWTLAETRHGTVVEWLGGWRPHGGVSNGIPLVADPFGTGLALLVAVLALAALVFSWRYFTEVHAAFHALILLFVAGMCGFALTGDLFDQFVFFELMSVIAYVLTGYLPEEPKTVHGALGFGVVNSLGAYLTLTGIAILYSQTGELGLAAIGGGLDDAPGAVRLAGFVLVVTGFLVKGAAVPFHFWLADAHAVAPTPVCVLFSGVMVELGVYAVARLYWATFAGADAAPGTSRSLAVLGVATALLGAVLCVAQRHVKRLLAYSTISHVGLLLVGVALLDGESLGGAAFFLLGHAGVKAALFLGAGALLNHFQSVDEDELHGRGGTLRVTTWTFLAGGLVLSGLPPSGLWAGKSAMETAAGHQGWWWVMPLGLVTSALTGGAVLRVWLHVFRGAGRPARHAHAKEGKETSVTLSAIPWTMVTPGMLLTAAALVLGAVPGVGRALASGAAAFTDGSGYAAAVLHGARTDVPGADGPHLLEAEHLAVGGLTVAAAFAVAAVGVWGYLLPRPLHRVQGWTRTALAPVRAAHSGHLGDYVAWLVAGVALLAAFQIPWR